MSSVTMAADSTQADFIHHRVRPAGKAALVRSGFGRGRQEGHRRVRSRSRHRSSSSRSHKPKRHSKEHQIRKGRRRRNNSRSRSHDDTSDRDSDLDLAKDLLPISGYVRIKDEMVDHMFRSISNRKLRAMLPEILRSLSSDELKRLCVEQLEVMSKKRICRILGGADPEAISSSGTDEYDDDEEDSSARSNDAEDDGPDVGRASAENEAVNSTSLPAVDDLLPLKDSIVTSHLKNEDGNGHGSARNDNPAINSFKNKELPVAADDTGRDSHTQDRDNGVMDGKMEEEGEKASTVREKASRTDCRELDGDEIFGITIKMNEARYQIDDPEGSADVGGGCSQEESMKMNKRNIERSYRAKQLDDDERENDSDGYGGRPRNVMEDVGSGIGVAHSKPKEKNREELSDSESIPRSLPSLDSEPEETCCPFVFLDTIVSQEQNKSVEVDQRSSSSGKLAEATVTTGGTESKEASPDCGSIVSQDTHGKISSLDQLFCQDGVAVTLATHKVTEHEEPINETEQTVSETERENKFQKKSCPPLASAVELANDGEEMIIEIHEHEFSDDVGDDDGCEGDARFERERETERKKGTEDSVKGNKILTETPEHKEAKGLDVQCIGKEAQFTDDKTLPSSEKPEMVNNRGLSAEKDIAVAGKTVILGRPKAQESEQRPMKRKSVDTADERLQSKMLKIVGKTTSGERRSEERSDSNSEQKKYTRMKDSGQGDGKAVPTCKADAESENRSNSASSVDNCHRSEGGGSSRASISLPTLKNDTSLAPSPAEQKMSKSPLKVSQASSTENTSSRKVIKAGNPDTASSARTRVERPELQISSSRVESSENIDVTGRLATSRVPHRTPSNPKLSSADCALSSETGKEPATPILSKTQLEILELEMRARAIKAMLKAQEELEKREEKVKLDEKRRSVIPSPGQVPRSSQSTEGRSTVRPESKMIRIGTSNRGEATAGPKTTGGADLAQRVIRGDVATPRQSQDKRLVERRPAAALAEGVSFTRTVQSNQVSVTRPGFKSFRDVVASGKFPTPANRFVKRPLASATRGRGGGGANSSCTTGSRIVRLSGGPRAANQSMVPVQKLAAMRQASGGPDKTAKMAGGDREDVRRVVASSLVSVRGSQALRDADNSLRYGHRDRTHGPSPNRDQKRSVVAWNRRGANYKQQVSRAGRF